ncbi:MAG: N-6 DNA methylase, partial [Planctomycetaceae bacterium]|nr:N-6 DNA methylase [Planctomycetaceae bacterium]
MMTKEAARQKIAELVEKYRSQIGTYENAHYDEANTRRDFLDDLFTALGWDIGNKKGLAESYREVILEDNVIVDGNSKAADYAFRLGKTVLFYVEAKKPSVNIKNNQEAAFQLRRYGWSKKEVTISILTNFKEFAVYDCTKKPNVKDKPHVARLTYLTFENFGETKTHGDWQDGFDFLWNTFEYNNVLRGSLEKYLKDNGDKQGIVTVDEAFLQLLEDWREVLARSICRTNQGINEEDLNFAVQEILNRIVFLRLVESRKIEPFGNLKKTIESNQCYKKLITLFQRADEKYNSGLFNFDRDKVSEKITVEDTVLKTIISELYYPSPYNFSQIPIEILGSVYEQFLGKTIRLTSSGKNVKVEEKPEVRKAGGVYYTPQYIVDYIVENTVGKLIKGKTPQEVAKIKIVDPACGCGIFLLGAYQFLLDWHKNYYFANDYDNGKVKSRGLKIDTLTPDYQLTTTEKKKILLNNIFGVDIDMIAVEVAKLSLLIKCVEGETEASIENTQRLFHEKVLPNIDSNIRCGNSLIGNDFYQQSNFQFSEQEQIKINAFDWKYEFPQVFKREKGMDLIICNPPWGADIFPYASYFETHYPHSTENHKDSFKIFIEKACSLVKDGGRIGMIVPSAFLFQPRYVDIRRFVRNNTTINYLWNIGDNVFSSKVVAPCSIFLVKKEKARRNHKVRFFDTTSAKNEGQRLILLEKANYTKIDQYNYYKTVAESFVAFFRELKDGETFFENVITFKDAGINYQCVDIGLYEKGKSDLSSRLLYEGKCKRKSDVEYWKGADIESYYMLSETGRFVNTNTVNDLYENERVVL